MNARNIVGGIALSLVVALAGAQTTIGRWCDLNWRIVTIAVGQDGTLTAHSEFGDGSSHVSKLRERSSGIFENVGSSHGDTYKIGSDGSLQLFDKEGFIRVALRLRNTARSGECLR